MADKPTAHKWREGEGAFIRTRLVLEPMPTIAEGEQVPKKVRALPWGEVELRDKAAREYWDEPGTLEVNDRTATDVEANFAKRDTDYFVNLNHSFHGKAYGWIESVETVKDDGIYLSVDWTREGEDLVRDRAYRYSSIEAVLDASAWSVDGSPAVVVAVTGLALTNDPAVIGQAPVAYQTLTAALSASDGREIERRQNSLGSTEEKGDRSMASDFWKKFLSRAAGKDLEDEVDAATEAAKLATIRENHDTLTADLTAATSQVSELTEKLEEANKAISEFEAANAERIETDQAGQIEAAVTAGKLAPTQSDWAKANFESFLSLVEGVKDGAVGPPKGRVVTKEAIGGVDTTALSGGDSASLDLEVKAHLKAHPELNGDYGLGWLAVTKAATEAAAGKEV